MHKVIIIGAGGHAKVIADIVIKRGDILLGFLDDTKTGDVLGEYSVLGKISEARSFSDDCEFIVAIGNNNIRKSIVEAFDIKWYTAIHPSAQIGYKVNIGEGTCVMANAVINSDTIVGDHCIINTSAVIEHDCHVSDYVHVSPGAVLCGTVKIGELTHIGAGATVKNNLSICENVTVGIGGAVVKDINVSGVYVGIPAKMIKQ